jgi:hypothetical protein
MVRYRLSTAVFSFVLAAALSIVVALPIARADNTGATGSTGTTGSTGSTGTTGSTGSTNTTSTGIGTGSQQSEDGSSTSPGACAGCVGWGDMPGGVAGRPYVTSLIVINDGVSTPVITNGTTDEVPLSNGGVTTVVAPFNLCAAGQTPVPGSCYATPNRVGLAVGYGNYDAVGMDFSNPGFPVSPMITANSIIDMTVAMNTLGKSLRWTWVNGDLLYWQTTNLGQDNATVHIKFKPASFPLVAHFPTGAGPTCTASPPANCSIQRADAEVLAANLVFSLDDTLDPAMTGAIFATQNAIAGYLTPGGTAQAPSLDIEVSSTHTKSDGTPQLGTIEAFLPAAALLNLYGILPADAPLAFSTTRLGDPGTNDPPTYTPWTAATNGSDGLLVTVKGITFSVPKYQLSSRLKPVTAHASTHGSSTTITASIAGCNSKHACLASVYDLGRPSAPRYLAAKTAVVSNRVIRAKTLSITGPVSKLKKGDRVLLVVRAAKHKKLLSSGIATVR